MIDLCFYMVGKVLRWSFQYISLIFVGVTLDQMEKLVKDKNEQEWSELKGRLADRTANINILSGLAVAASATYLVSNSPTDFADWNHQFPYFFIAGANGSAMLSVLSGLGLLIILNMMNLNSFREMQKWWLSYMLLFILLMMPLFFLAFASVAAGVGWIWAIWFGDKTWMKIVAFLACTVGIFTALVICGVLLYVARALVAADDSRRSNRP